MAANKDGPWKDKDKMHELYVEQELSTHEIARHFGDIAPQNVQYWLEKHDIETRPRGGQEKYTDEELLDWIDSFVEVVGVVPTQSDINSAPGPHGLTYVNRFGTFTEAVRQAGYTPRGDQE